MATKLFLRSTQANGIGATYFDMLATAGAGSTTAVVDTDGSTEKQWTQTSGGALIQWVSGRAPSGGFTLTTTDISIWAHESGTAANAGGAYRLFKRAANGTETELDPASLYADGVEFTKATPTEMTWAGNPTDTAFAENDRILLKLAIANVGSMGTGQTCTLTYNAADAATGDSFLNIAETVTFKAESTEVSAGVASLTTTGFSASANIETGVAADAGSLALTAFDAALNVETGIAADAGSLALANFAATVTGTAPPTEVNASTASLTLSPQNASTNIETAFTASAGSLALTSFNAALNVETAFTSGTTALTLAPQNATVKTDTAFTASAGSLSFTTQNASLNVETAFTANSAALSLSSLGATVTVGGNVDVLAASASLGISPFSAAVKANTSFTAAAQALLLTGFPATVDVSGAVTVDVNAGLAPLSLVAHAASVGLTLRQSHPKEFVVMESRRRRLGFSI